MKKIIMIALAVGSFIVAFAQHQSEEIRPVYATYTVEGGSSHLADTYLSPVRYTGWHAGLAYDRLQAMKFDPEQWVQQLKFKVYTDRTENMDRNATMWNFGISGNWGMMRRWILPCGFSAGAGGAAEIEAGCLYLNRNGNNPASAKASATLNITGYCTWSHTFGRVPVRLRYQPTIPLTGAFFSPDYGELYYEIYLGNCSGLAHWAWPGNYFRMDHQFTADISLGATNLRIGYCGRIFTTEVNDITTRIFTHSVVFGVSGEWISVDPRKGLSADARIISATY